MLDDKGIGGCQRHLSAIAFWLQNSGTSATWIQLAKSRNHDNLILKLAKNGRCETTSFSHFIDSHGPIETGEIVSLVWNELTSMEARLSAQPEDRPTFTIKQEDDHDGPKMDRSPRRS